MLRSCVAVVVLSVVPAPTSSAAGDDFYQVGVARIDITPDYPIRLNGFGFRRTESEGVTQQVWAKALAISSGDEPPAVLLAIDNLGVRMSMVDQVADELMKKYRIPRERVALTYSHSHTTPKVNGACDNIFSQPIPADHQTHIDRYTDDLTRQLKEVACLAVEGRRPSRLERAVGKVELAKNRRTAGGPVDHDLPLLAVRGPDGGLRAIYVSYACHCVTLSHNKISGDWAGYAQQMIEQRYPDCVSLISIGAGSDLNPASGVVKDRVDIATSQGKLVADEVDRLLAGSLQPVTGSLSASLRCIDLPLNTPPSREQLDALVKKGGPAGYNAQTQLKRLDRGESLLEFIHYPIQSFRFGDDLQMVFLAGEVCVDYSLRLKRELGQDLWVNAYSNDFGCYIPSERLVKEGGYGGGSEIPYFALPATLKSGLEDRIVSEVIRQMRRG